MAMSLLSKMDFDWLKGAVALEVEEMLEQLVFYQMESDDTGSKPTSLFWGAMQSLTANNAASLSKTVTASCLMSREQHTVALLRPCEFLLVSKDGTMSRSGSNGNQIFGFPLRGSRKQKMLLVLITDFFLSVCHSWFLQSAMW